MFKLPTRKTPILCQGITTEMGLIHTEQAIAYGSHIVAGTSRDKSVRCYQDIPVFQTVREAVRKTKPAVSVIFATPARALAEVEEAVKAKIPMIVCTTEHVPLHDMLKMVSLTRDKGITFIGPSSTGIVRTGECLVGSLPAHLFPKGRIGIIGRSSSLVYEAVQQLAEEGLGVSTCVSLGAAMWTGLDFVPVWEALTTDKKTDAVLVVGQKTGEAELDLAMAYRQAKHRKPLIVYIPDQTTADNMPRSFSKIPFVQPADVLHDKRVALEKAGAVWVERVSELGRTVAVALTQHPKRRVRVSDKGDIPAEK